MSKWTAAVITAFPIGPGLVVVLVSWLITRWQTSGHDPIEVQALGVVLIAAGGILMVATFVRFPAEGSGVSLPTDPPSSQLASIGEHAEKRTKEAA